jgi:hypothetical protein
MPLMRVTVGARIGWDSAIPRDPIPRRMIDYVASITRR